MTVIATDGRSVSGDSLITAHDQVVGHFCKVHRLKDGRIIGLAGLVPEMRKLLHWIEHGGEKPTLDDDAEALILDPDGTVWHIERALEPIAYVTPITIGCGGDIALGAMLAGASPEDGVKAAIQRHRLCGGEITTIERTPLLKVV